MNAGSHLALADALTRARSAYDDLLALGEEVEDEWSYVNDLATAWHSRLDDVESHAARFPALPGRLEEGDPIEDGAVETRQFLGG